MIDRYRPTMSKSELDKFVQNNGLEKLSTDLYVEHKYIKDFDKHIYRIVEALSIPKKQGYYRVRQVWLTQTMMHNLNEFRMRKESE